MKVKLIAISGLLLVCWLGGSCAPAQNLDSCLSAIVKPYHFSIARWESEAILYEVNQWVFSRDEKLDGEVQVVTEYFSSVERINTLRSEIAASKADNGTDELASLEAELDMLQERKLALEDAVERIVERQVRETLAQQGIFNPIDKYIGLRVSFPPVNFKLEKPPCLLVVSPRGRVESMREILLMPDLSLEEMESIEAEVDKRGVSSLVVGIGGLGVTYPTLVTNQGGLRFTIDAVTEEWLHQYLVFRPLGFLYLLDLTGVSRNYEIATMNETLASMVSKEIGAIVYEKYYTEYDNGANQSQVAESGFDFNQGMREIRRAVDEYLARGEVEQAEEFMEQKRQYLASKGYHIRKLNQAYFAFYGTYADRPTSISPIGLELKELRSQSASLKDFLNRVATMASRQNLRDRLR